LHEAFLKHDNSEIKYNTLFERSLTPLQGCSSCFLSIWSKPFDQAHACAKMGIKAHITAQQGATLRQRNLRLRRAPCRVLMWRCDHMGPHGQ
jgi:hypothetical protein